MDHVLPLNGVKSTSPSPPPEADLSKYLLLHRRSLSGGLLSKLSITTAEDDDDDENAPELIDRSLSPEYTPGDDASVASRSKKSARSMATVVQQQNTKTRRRNGSLRKVALLGQGVQRGKRELETSPLTATDVLPTFSSDVSKTLSSSASSTTTLTDVEPPTRNIEQFRPPSAPPPNPTPSPFRPSSVNSTSTLPTSSASPTPTYTSTTEDDEEDILTIPPKHLLAPQRTGSSASESYFTSPTTSLTRRRSTQKQQQQQQQQQQPPLSSSSTTPLTPSTSSVAVHTAPHASSGSLPAGGSGIGIGAGAENYDYEYASTEWWGWVILVCTWLVFVVGMGSCFGVWSWAWDVGETPYAPPELEDDVTLPIVGYYPALIILTAVMAWVWVVVAWVGMKYFRHARVGGD